MDEWVTFTHWNPKQIIQTNIIAVIFTDGSMFTTSSQVNYYKISSFHLIFIFTVYRAPLIFNLSPSPSLFPSPSWGNLGAVSRETEHDHTHTHAHRPTQTSILPTHTHSSCCCCGRPGWWCCLIGCCPPCWGRRRG